MSIGARVVAPVLALSILLLPVIATGQSAEAAKATFTLQGMTLSLQWQLTIAHSQSPSLSTSDIEKLISGEEFQKDPLAKWSDQYRKTFSRINRLGEDRVFWLGEQVPAGFWPRGDSGCPVVFAAVSMVQNTIQRSAKQRAGATLQRNVLPGVEYVVDAFDKKSDCVGLFVTYGSRDFTDDSVTALEPETVGLVFSPDFAKKYIGGEITDQEFVNGSDVLHSPRGSFGDFRKISVVLE